MAGAPRLLRKPAAQTILYRDLFAVVDDGNSKPSDYAQFKELILEQRARHPEGIGGLVIIPEHSKPPSEDVRKAINSALKALEGGLVCFCWLVECRGFQAAVARGVLTGIRLFANYSYPTYIARELDEAMGWLGLHLHELERHGIDAAIKQITAARAGHLSLLSA